MPTIPEAKQQWYVVHVLSGQEQKVANRIRRKMEEDELKDKIYDVLVPTEMVSEIKRGKKSETKRKFYPGYVIVHIEPAGHR